MGDVVVIGLQWGDEGKGKVVDERAADCAAVVRYQGGANAGHSVAVDGRSYAFHQVPCGVLHPGVGCIIAAGCAVDPVALRAEVAALHAAGAPLPPDRLVVSGHAQVVLPWMAVADAAEERLRGTGAIGTTLRGIGPAYAAKAARWGMTVGAFVDPVARRERLEAVRPWTERWLAALEIARPAGEEALEAAAAWLAPYVADDVRAIAVAAGRGPVCFEGQLGLMRDPDRGAYPFVTGASILPQLALPRPGAQVLGVAKPYLTLVGTGVAPTEADPAQAEALRLAGGEFGVTTGRPRRCGWLDLPALRYAVAAVGATQLAVTKLDLLAGWHDLPVCVGYVGWDEGRGYPLAHRWDQIRPRYERWSIDGDPIGFARRMAAAVGLPLAYVGTGPGRGEGRWLLPAE